MGFRSRAAAARPVVFWLACVLVGWAQTPVPRYEVRRLALDGLPGAVVIRLGDELWAAYDPQSCQLWKVWRDGVELRGTVFDTVHQIQPRSAGVPYAVQKALGGAWSARRGEVEVGVRPVFRGYRYAFDGYFSLHYDLRLDDGGVCKVAEQLEVAAAPDGRADAFGFRRTWTLLEAPDGVTVVRRDALDSPSATIVEAQFVAPGAPSRATPQAYAGAASMTLASPSAASHLVFRRQPGAAKPPKAPKKPRVAFRPRAEDTPDAATPAPPEVDAPPTATENGLSLRVYEIAEPLERLQRLVPGQTANVNRLIKNVDLRDARDDFGGLRDNFVAVVSGWIQIDQPGAYRFRLYCDDGARLSLDDRSVVDFDGIHRPGSRVGTVELAAGLHKLRVDFFEAWGEAELRLDWAPPGVADFAPVPESALLTQKGETRVTSPGPKKTLPPLQRPPGDGRPLEDVHPSYAVATVRPETFEPAVGGMDFLPDGRLVIAGWDPDGAVYLVAGATSDDPAAHKATVFARGLNEPTGVKVVDGRIYVAQKQELTELVDANNDGVCDEYRTVAGGFPSQANYHEFTFGPEWKDGTFWLCLAVAIGDGGLSSDPQMPDRGSVIRIDPATGDYTVVARGLRTPNGIGVGPGGDLFVADNQGGWLPASKIVRIRPDTFHGSKAVRWDPLDKLKDVPPVVWLPQGEIGNSPSQPQTIPANHGAFAGQLVFGDVTHGGLKRVFVEEIDGVAQGAAFRFVQGLEAGINRLVVGPDGALYVGGIGSTGNWRQEGKGWFGLQRLRYTGAPSFGLVALRARPDGFEAEFSEPLDPRATPGPEDVRVRRYRYEATAEYGGPKLDETDVAVRAAKPSADRRRLRIVLADLKSGFVHHLRLSAGLLSAAGRPLWSPEAWYTLNVAPQADPPDATKAEVPPAAPNVVAAADASDGWTALFDGASLNGWRTHGKDGPPQGWSVVDGALVRTGDGGDLETTATFRDFELAFDWALPAGGNSGVRFRVDDGPGDAAQSGPEFQLLDNGRHADGADPFTSAGACYGLFAPKYDATAFVGAWNRARLVVRGADVEHWLNGRRVTSYRLGSDDWNARVAGSKFKDRPRFGRAAEGRVVLQDHGAAIRFRNVFVRRLP
jgi:cytochrome c